MPLIEFNDSVDLIRFSDWLSDAVALSDFPASIVCRWNAAPSWSRTCASYEFAICRCSRDWPRCTRGPCVSPGENSICLRTRGSWRSRCCPGRQSNHFSLSVLFACALLEGQRKLLESPAEVRTLGGQEATTSAVRDIFIWDEWRSSQQLPSTDTG